MDGYEDLVRKQKDMVSWHQFVIFSFKLNIYHKKRVRQVGVIVRKH